MGIVLAVGFDDMGALDSLWVLHQRGKLSMTFQDVIVNSTVLKKLKTTKIVLRSKILESEYKNCTNELLSRKLQIHSICESEKQKQIKKDIRKKINNGQELMKPEAPLKIVIHPVWARKILPREQSLFRGLVCVLPLAVEALKDIDFMLDEYINDFVL
ncbi:uncharacterized protein LOC127732238 [Mytilus californianus]|uniref:uncharacterized protein LOC127732238 n=1 Tax=Mytilus californianus TaxID=6549 RepID=UPI002247106E|nr:uncharacterized protein LOC127732238 [Mytilus californianus]